MQSDPIVPRVRKSLALRNSLLDTRLGIDFPLFVMARDLFHLGCTVSPSQTREAGQCKNSTPIRTKATRTLSRL